jgi:antitoxin component YwqK of YwqJK toxin-antitoxin module
LLSCTETNNNNSKIKSEVASVEKQSYSGVVTEYYKNGNKKYETKYVNGKPSGKYLTWFKNGTKKAEGEYQNGQRVGLWKWYNEKGKVNFTVIYDNTGIAEM